jgi:hypothetical protein
MNRAFEQGKAFIHDLRTRCVLRRAVAIDKLDWRFADARERSPRKEDHDNEDSQRVHNRSVSKARSENQKR